MSRALTLLALVLSLATGSHAESMADARKAIAVAQAAWTARGPQSYEFTVRLSEFIYVYCEEQSFRVTRGHTQVLPSADCHQARDPVSIGTIPRLLKYAHHLARGSWPSVDFRFDTTIGVPYVFDVWDESIEDSFSGFAVTRSHRADICDADDEAGIAKFRGALRRLGAQLDDKDWAIGVDHYRMRIGDEELSVSSDAWTVDIEGPKDLVRRVLKEYRG